MDNMASWIVSEVVNLNTGKLLFSKLQTGASLVYEAACLACFFVLW